MRCIHHLKYIWSAFFFLEFGRYMYFIIISWILYEMTNDALYTGALVSVGFIPSLLINLLFGVIVDRFNRRKLTFYASLISAMTVLIIWILILNEWLTPISIILSHMIIQLMGSLFRPAIQALVAEIFDQKNLPRVFSQSGSAAIIGGLLGASCGGLIVGVTSAFTATSIVFTSFLLTSFAVQLIKENSTNDNRNLVKNNIRTDLADGFVYLRNNLFLLELFSVMFVGQLVFHTSIAFLSVYVNEYLEKSVSVYGFLDASISIGGVIAGMLGARWWNLNKRYLSINSLLVIASGLLLVGLSPYLVSVFLGAMLIGLGTTWIRVLLQSVQQIATDKAYHGRMASYRMICNQGSVVISAPILGWVANTYGANMVYVTLLLPVGVAILFSVRQQKNKKFIAITEESV
ncbi:MFS transporter [Gracilibacillus kekensis]|uniref:Transmembrane secretion effector n=1 Tax=Gracilibacillus kekensis TaxID=1027249 RepID=A0A1M7IX85_9BACI|nr:MFS transporter [Gracilibacillus kekensis]SHM45390.1 Transmembrane secretion effector [Gracilibacillus kekensis]